MTLILSRASTRGGGKKRRKKLHYNVGYPGGYRIIVQLRGYSGQRWQDTDRQVSLTPQSANIVDLAVSRCSFVCSGFAVTNRNNRPLPISNTVDKVDLHSFTECRGISGRSATAIPSSATIGKVTNPRSRCKFDLFVALFLVFQALLASTSTATTASAAFAPSSSLLPNTRYKLVPASQTSESIVIYFNPPSILSLKINTRQSVYFNFSLHRKQSSDNTSQNLISTNRTTINSNNITIPSQKGKDLLKLDKAAGTLTTRRSEITRNNISQSIPSLTSTSSYSAISNISSWSFQKTLDKLTTSANLNDSGGAVYWVMIYSDDDSIARPVINSPNGLAVAHADAKGSYILMAVWAGRQHNFSVEARHIGRATMSLAVVNVSGDRRMPQASYVQAVAASQYPVTAVRGERIADLVFNISAAAIAIIISFGIGAVTDTDSLKRQIKFPVPLIIGFCCQFILMPVMTFAVATMLPLDNEILFGLLCVACVPGGGISHVAVIIADGDIALSLTMNLINVVAMLGTAPLWIFVLGQYFQADPQTVLNPRMIPIYSFEIWFASIFFAYVAGLVIKKLRPIIADAILMWLIKPFLLLASILYITLGVYINMYVFELINGHALLAAMLLPLSGCILGGVLAAICRQSYAYIKTIALETSSMNCLVVMVAIRFSLKQPDADLAAVIPIWVMFTIPGFFVFLAICNKVKSILLHFWRNRNNKDSEAMSSSKAYSVSSSVVSPPGTTTMSAPLVTTGCLDDDATISTMSNQKVTVL